MTTQQAYEEIRAYFSQPGATLARVQLNPDEAPNCKYRTDDGRKCAVGCLIPDELYDPKWESSSAFSLLRSEPVLRNFFEIKDPTNDKLVNFLDGAQTTHDSTTTISVKDFIHKLDRFAAEFGLKVAT